MASSTQFHGEFRVSYSVEIPYDQSSTKICEQITEYPLRQTYIRRTVRHGTNETCRGNGLTGPNGRTQRRLLYCQLKPPTPIKGKFHDYKAYTGPPCQTGVKCQQPSSFIIACSSIRSKEIGLLMFPISMA